MRNSPATLNSPKTKNTVAVSSGCVVCGGPLKLRFPAVRDAQTQEVFSILECASCGLGHTSPRPEDLAPYYREYYGGRHGVTANYCARRRLGLVNRATGKADGRRLLDMGCGEGTFLSLARNAGWRVAGTEMNPGPARAAGLDVIEDLQTLSEAASFDCITLWHSLEHMQDPAATLRQVHKLLAPGGVVLLAVPDAGGWQAQLFGKNWLHLDTPRHLYHFNRKSLTTLLKATEFLPLKCWYQEFEYDLLGWSQSALNKFSPNANVFFELLTGRMPQVSSAEKAANWLLGTLLAGLALPVVSLSAMAGKGGTLVVAAQPQAT